MDVFKIATLNFSPSEIFQKEIVNWNLNLFALKKNTVKFTSACD